MIRKLRYMAMGAMLAYFFDPQNGRRRRALARQRVPAFFRNASRKVGAAGSSVAAEASAAKQKATHLKEEEKPQPAVVQTTAPASKSAPVRTASASKPAAKSEPKQEAHAKPPSYARYAFDCR